MRAALADLSGMPRRTDGAALRAAGGAVPLTHTPTAVAHRHGYSDYAHMHREFLDLAGAAPTSFAVTRSALGAQASGL